MIQTDLVEFHWGFMGHHGFHGDSMGSLSLYIYIYMHWDIEWEYHGMYTAGHMVICWILSQGLSYDLYNGFL